MRALQFITDHVIFELRYNQIYEMKTTITYNFIFQVLILCHCCLDLLSKLNLPFAFPFNYVIMKMSVYTENSINLQLNQVIPNNHQTSISLALHQPTFYKSTLMCPNWSTAKSPRSNFSPQSVVDFSAVFEKTNLSIRLTYVL